MRPFWRLVSLNDRPVVSPTFTLPKSQAKTPSARRLRVHAWFDAFRTMKVIHALRDRVFPNLPWRDALALAPFVPKAEAADPELIGLRRAMQAAEDALPARLGPTVLRGAG